MSEREHALLLIGVMAAVTAALRCLPFVLLGNRRTVPPVVHYLGRVLPYAIMGMLVVYCLKGVEVRRLASLLPAVLGVGVTAGLQWWRRQTILSILGGTAVYMLLVQLLG